MHDAIKPAAVSFPELERFIDERYATCGGEAYGITRSGFAIILSEIRAKYMPQADLVATREFYSRIKVEELVLARACAAGNERAWEAFLTRYREKLYDMAGYIAKESSAARELADSLYADLYGTNVRDGQRISKLASYTGQGSLEGWLRTVLAQEFVNRYRRQRRNVSLEEENEQGVQFAAPQHDTGPSVDPRLEAATDEALLVLSAEDRFVLASYYLDERTLADIARTLGVHESTISRKLDKLAKALRKQILAGLGRRGMSRRQAHEALDVDVRDLQVNIRRSLTQEKDARTFPRKSGAEAGDGTG